MIVNPIELELLSWRRKTAELYAAVRAISATDPARARELFMDGRNVMFREHPQSPLDHQQRRTFETLRYFDYDPRWRIVSRVVSNDRDGDGESAPGTSTAPVASSRSVADRPSNGGPNDATAEAPTVSEPTVGAPLAADLPEGTLRFRPFGRVYFHTPGNIPGSPQSVPAALTLYWLLGYGGGLFLPFRDRTNGEETYGGGRYLFDTIKGADLGHDGDEIVLDFNFAYHPSCAYSPQWICPLAPPQNRLAFSIEAGERLYNSRAQTGETVRR